MPDKPMLTLPEDGRVAQATALWWKCPLCVDLWAKVELTWGLYPSFQAGTATIHEYYNNYCNWYWQCNKGGIIWHYCRLLYCYSRIMNLYSMRVWLFDSVSGCIVVLSCVLLLLAVVGQWPFAIALSFHYPSILLLKSRSRVCWPCHQSPRHILSASSSHLRRISFGHPDRSFPANHLQIWRPKWPSLMIEHKDIY